MADNTLDALSREDFEEAIESAHAENWEAWRDQVLIFADWLEGRDDRLAENLRLLMGRAEILHDHLRGDLLSLEYVRIYSGPVYSIQPGEHGQTTVGEEEVQDEEGHWWPNPGYGVVGFHGSDEPPTDGEYLMEDGGQILVAHQSETAEGVKNPFGWEITPADLDANWWNYDGGSWVYVLRREGNTYWIAEKI
jgi:hypothetical protein